MIERGINPGLLPLIKAEAQGKTQAAARTATAESSLREDSTLDIYPKGLVSPALIAERRLQYGVVGYVMGQPKR
jgi:hypothetical protein